MHADDVFGAWAPLIDATPGTVTGLFLDDHCANCAAPLPPQEQQLYCRQPCKLMAKHVRYWRRVERDGRIEDPDVREVLQQRMATMNYPDRERRLSPAQREHILTRDDHRCVRCGALGTEIDHITTSSADPTNLQLLCTPCHRAKSAADRAHTDDARACEHTLFVLWLQQARVIPDHPVLLCDEDNWNALRIDLSQQRRARLLAQLAERGHHRADFRGVSWAAMWDQVLDLDVTTTAVTVLADTDQD